MQIYFWHNPIVNVLVWLKFYKKSCVFFGVGIGKIIFVLSAAVCTVLCSLPPFSHPTGDILKIAHSDHDKANKSTQEKQARETSAHSLEQRKVQEASTGVLDVRNVSIRYMTGDFKDIGLKEYVMRRLKGNYQTHEFWADKNISFSLEKGDMLGIIGTNGAGKSTLLKAISGIMEPTKGTVKRHGTIAALLELASGFDGDLTVRENTYLRGAMLGYTREFMDETYSQIIKFAELEEFQDRPFKQLSSGMKSRLAFSIASLVQPDILILDEVLSVGDGAFRKKSVVKMREIIAGGATTILVSHSIDQVRDMCTKVLWLHKGEQVEFGTDVQDICDRYEEFLEKRRFREGSE